MSVFKKGKPLNRKSDLKGVTSYNDVYDIIQDNVDTHSEFYEIEPAVVLEVRLDPKTFDKKKLPNNQEIPDYSWFGTIRARFLESQKEGDEIKGKIKPLSPHIISYPLVGETVNICSHSGQYYYYNPLNLKNKVNVNLKNNETGDGIVRDDLTDLNRMLFSEQGDVVINGRFGQGIKFGSDPSYQYPDIKITNRQSAPDMKSIDENYTHFQNINADGSSIFMTSGPMRKADELSPACENGSTPEVLDGDMITINSDKLVFNAKGSPLASEEGVPPRKNNGDIHMFANKNLNLTANNEINIELGYIPEDPFTVGRITLGDPDSVNPVVKGKQLVELIFKLFSNLNEFSNTLSTSTGVEQIAAAAEKLNSDLVDTKITKVPLIVSDTVWITEDANEEITEINVVEGEVQQVVTVAGVRG